MIFGRGGYLINWEFDDTPVDDGICDNLAELGAFFRLREQRRIVPAFY